jgi:hypothetical protein
VWWVWLFVVNIKIKITNNELVMCLECLEPTHDVIDQYV